MILNKKIVDFYGEINIEESDHTYRSEIFHCWFLKGKYKKVIAFCVNGFVYYQFNNKVYSEENMLKIIDLVEFS